MGIVASSVFTGSPVGEGGYCAIDFGLAELGGFLIVVGDWVTIGVAGGNRGTAQGSYQPCFILISGTGRLLMTLKSPTRLAGVTLDYLKSN